MAGLEMVMLTLSITLVKPPTRPGSTAGTLETQGPPPTHPSEKEMRGEVPTAHPVPVPVPATQPVVKW
jgi:hypothetical protein